MQEQKTCHTYKRCAKQGQHGHANKVVVRMGVDAGTKAERSSYTVPLMFEQHKDENGVARFEVNVMIDGVLRAQVLIRHDTTRWERALVTANTNDEL